MDTLKVEDREKSLDRWRFELKRNKKVWPNFYYQMIGKPASSYPRLYKLLNLYGDWALFEAIVDSGTRSLDFNQDPLNYVSKVTKELWKEQQKKEDDLTEYQENIKTAKYRTEERNKALSEKIQTASKAEGSDG